MAPGDAIKEWPMIGNRTSKARAVLMVIVLRFGAMENASAQDRMPPIPADKLSADQKEAVEEFRVDCSPDGKYLTYTSSRSQTDNNRVLVIRSIETGQVRESPPLKLTYFASPLWTRDGRSLMTKGIDLKGRDGVYRIDAQTFEVTPLLQGLGNSAAQSGWSSDGARIYFRRRIESNLVSFVERDVASGAEREIIRRPDLRVPTVSPDGRHIVTHFEEPSASVVLLIPLAAGEPRELLRTSQQNRIGMFLTWTPDSSAIIVNKALDAKGEQREYWLVPIAGGQSRKLDGVTPIGNFPLAIHPDGRQIAFLAGERKAEVWALENFLPSLNANK
jgi:Tol biopolymer transport system component